MSQDRFWDFYKEIEEASRLSLEEFLRDESAYRRALEGIRGCLSVVEEDARRVAGRVGLDTGGGLVELAYRLARAHLLDVKLIGDLEDVYAILNRSGDRSLLYSALIRSMEVIEAVRSSLLSHNP